MDAARQKPRTVPRSEILNSTARLSPLEDFVERTMGAVQGLLAKLNYISKLRGKDGTYRHWGFTRTHGVAAAQAAVAEVHSELTLEILRMPIAELLRDLQSSAESGVDVTELANSLYSNEENATPEDLTGGSSRHLHSVLLAVRLLSLDVAKSGREDGSAKGKN